MEKWTIGETARQAEVEPSTLRYYESIGLLLPAERVNGQRRYDEEALKRLSIIKVSKEAGFTLKEIGMLLGGFSEKVPPSAQWKALASEKLVEIDALIARAEGMKRLLEEGMECDCLSLDKCMVYVE
jgi:MerR family redox-sensitive transcriptional activator SoxR